MIANFDFVRTHRSRNAGPSVVLHVSYKSDIHSLLSTLVLALVLPFSNNFVHIMLWLHKGQSACMHLFSWKLVYMAPKFPSQLVFLADTTPFAAVALFSSFCSIFVAFAERRRRSFVGRVKNSGKGNSTSTPPPCSRQGGTDAAAAPSGPVP